MNVTGTLVGQWEEAFNEPISFNSQSSADTAAEAVEQVKHSLEKHGFVLGPHIFVRPTPDYRRLLENFETITGESILKGVVS